MKRVSWLLGVAFFVSLAWSTAAAGGLLFDKSEYAARRQKLMDKIPDGVAIVLGAQSPTSYGFFQNNDFIYLSGVEIPGAVLIIDGRKKETNLFFTMSERAARGEGIRQDLIKNPKEVTGIEKVYPGEAFSSVLQWLASQVPVFYTSFKPEELARDISVEKFRSLYHDMVINDWDGRLTRELQFVRLLRERYPQVAVRDSTELIRDLRKIKSVSEIEVLRKAGRIAVKADIEVMKATRPGLYEYELSSLFEYLCKRAGCRDLAFETIISSAENHAYIHYSQHDRLLADGDFLVVDAGPRFDYYDIDVTVSYPANGKFTPRQREIYEACNEVSKACLSLYRPGITGFEVGEKARQILQAKGYDLGKDVFTRLRFFKEGGLTHYVGLAVHDAAGKDLDPAEPLQPGMVFASDVYAVYPEENLGVRVENTVLIAENGCENLTPGLPRETSEIEALMKQKGVIQTLKEKGIYFP